MARNMSNDELYESLREKAFELQGEAGELSKAADDAHMRKDHKLCCKLRKQAQVKWAKVRRLHEAASEAMFQIKNANKSKFVIDLHGLHASEAVDFVKRRLVKLDDSIDTGRPLLVITGKGNHSRVKPKLPAAIKDFCEENGYYYKEGRPGTILVSSHLL